MTPSPNIWDDEPPMPDSRDPKYNRSEVDWRISENPVDFFKSVEYMRDLEKWKKNHGIWKLLIKIRYEYLETIRGQLDDWISEDGTLEGIIAIVEQVLRAGK